MLLSSYMCQKYTENSRLVECANNRTQRLLLLRRINLFFPSIVSSVPNRHLALQAS